MTPIEKLLETAQNEVGYLEKASNSNLDGKTTNVGSSNYTKYARDFDTKFPNFYNGRKNGYAWCDVFADWCFVTTFGVAAAQQMINQPNKSYGAGCDYSQNYYKAMGRLYTKPQPGDQVFFGTSHTGIVSTVNGNKFWTIEGNTNAGNTVIPNGGGVHAKGPYTLNSTHKFGRPRWSIVGGSDADAATAVINVGQYPKLGWQGNAVKALQENLNKLGYKLTVDGDFGQNTDKAVKDFQTKNKLVVDGEVGPKTQTAIEAALNATKKVRATVKLGSKNEDVKALQTDLNKLGYNLVVDGDFGQGTLKAIKDFQSKHGLVADGVAGPLTYEALKKVVG